MAGQSLPPNKKVVKNLISELFSFIISSSIVCVWILTGHWLLMDVLGMGFCVTFIANVRLPSLKVSTLLLVGLVAYDIFWVYSPPFNPVQGALEFRK